MAAALYTLEQTLKDQQDLEKLCRDRPLQTNEIFSPNAFYGIDYVIKSYAGLPSNYKLKIIFPHGMRLGRTIWDVETRSLLPTIAAYDEEYKAILENYYIHHGINKIVLPMTFAFSYIPMLLKGHQQPDRNGTIFFPQHSTHHVTVQADFEAVAESLERFEKRYQPITVCIYWRDYNLGHHLPFAKRGFKIVSAGHIYDPLFLFRFYRLCSMHQFAASNQPGSNLFYAVKSGCDFFFIDVAREYVLKGDPARLKSDVGGIKPELKEKLFSVFHKKNIGMNEEKMELVDYYMGTKYLLPSEKLMDIIKEADHIFMARFFHRQWMRGLNFLRRVFNKFFVANQIRK
ncbi:MAG: hypothetical protein C4518_15675 [Desulfobacteraceae bacterium]|nr:MAG: hypothetical protein C4518_15675 [Desulfobacteraceae bacterium]